MTQGKRNLGIVLLAFLIGTALPISLIWNPFHWHWPDHLMAKLKGPEDSGKSEEGQLWTCGMHPQVIQDEPGICPICNMNLVPMKSAQDDPTPAKERKIKYWVAPMDPTFISDKPGKSPMGMDLVPVYEEEKEDKGIRVDPSFVQNFAIRKTIAEKGSIPVEIRTVGALSFNQKNITAINTKFEGWIEKSNVNYIGEPVRRGQVLFEIYSPQLVTTQQEYLAALDYVERLSSGASNDALGRAKSLLKATAKRLEYWDITEDQIADLREIRKPMRTVKIESPVSGIVVEKMGDSLEGVRITPGINVYKIADLSTVWVEIEVYEHQIQHVREGQRALITVDAFPGRRWSGKIAYLDPTLKRDTRTLKAYVEVNNSDRKLRPEMYANIEIRIPRVGGVVVIPEEAVLRSGERSIVIVEIDTGLFEPREVTLGIQGDGLQAILSGVEPGEMVVTSSQFMIDSESNLKEAIKKMLAERENQKDPGNQNTPNELPQ